MKTKKISTQLTIKFSIIMIILVILFNFVLSFIFGIEILEERKVTLDRKLKLIDAEISKNYNTIIELIKELREDEDLQHLVKKNYDLKKISLKDRYEISKILYNYSKTDNFITSIIALNNKKIPIDTTGENKDLTNNLMKNPILDFYIKNDLYIYFSKKLTKIYNQSENFLYGDFISCLSEYYDDLTFEQYGHLLINLDSGLFFQSVSDILDETFDETYIINTNDEVIYTNSELDIKYLQNKKKVDGRFYFFKYNNLYTIDNEKYLYYEYSLSTYSNTKIIGLISYEKEISSFDHLVTVSFIIALFFIIIIIFSTNIVALSITAPIRKICDAMVSIKDEENFSNQIEINSNEEINILVSGFNEMLGNIKNLISQIKIKEQRAKEYEIAQIQSDLDLLQAQINPHFIHNTLNAISILSIEKGCDDVSKMIRSLNLLLRGSMDIKKRYVTLKEEISYIKGYIELCRYRYGTIFTFEFNCPPEYEFNLIPKFILQPIVENALYHGIIPKDSGGKIVIDICKIQNSNDLNIKVTDDGLGIEKEKLKTFFTQKDENHRGGFNQLSMLNIKKRLNLSFGENYTINIFSEINKGTTIEFRIPIFTHYKNKEMDIDV